MICATAAAKTSAQFSPLPGLVALYSHISPARENQNFFLVPIASALAGASSGTKKTLRGSAGTVNRGVEGCGGQASGSRH